MQARDVMTAGVQTVGPNATIDAAIKIMIDRRVSGVPVVDDAGALVGILTEGDLLRRIETGTHRHLRAGFLDFLIGSSKEVSDYVRTHSRRISDLMTTQLVTVTEDATLEEVVRLMERRHVRRVPVVRGTILVGIVSRSDLIKALGHKLAAMPPGPASDAEIEAHAQAELHDSSWFSNSSIGIHVQGGVATLEGIIHDERMRDAIRVAVENVPGVIAIRDKIVFVEPMTGVISPA